MEISAMSDVGRQRQNNEDNYFVYRNESLWGGMISDGMGGEKAGELASKMAVDIVKHHIICNFDPKMDYMRLAEVIREWFMIANREIYKKAQGDEFSGMGTTGTLAMVFDNKLIIAHVGDSRCYLIGKNFINQLTDDHSYVEELVRSGHITESDARVHPKKNMITRALGTDISVKVDMNIMAYNGDTILLCSDGLTNMISDQQILQTVEQNGQLDDAVTGMIELANKKGGNDNITVIVCRY